MSHETKLLSAYDFSVFLVTLVLYHRSLILFITPVKCQYAGRGRCILKTGIVFLSLCLIDVDWFRIFNFFNMFPMYIAILVKCIRIYSNSINQKLLCELTKCIIYFLFICT